MLIICPKCFAKYEIDTQQFNEETHIFQCSNCGKRFEERVHFDDEKNENQQSVPPAFITEQPILAPLSENDYISSNRAAMDFTPQSSVVLPEEFTPVGDTGSSIGRKIIFTIILLFVLGLGAGSVYIWMNKAVLLKKYPEVQRAIDLIMTPTKSVQSSVSQEDLPMEGDIPAIPQTQEVVLTPIEQKMQEGVKDESVADNRILPVETETVIYPKQPTAEAEQPAQPVEQPLPTEQSAQLVEQPLPTEQSAQPAEQLLPTEQATQSAEQPIPADQPVIEEVVVPTPDMPNAVIEPTVPEVLPVEEEIILEEIPLPAENIVPVPEQSETELNVSATDIQIRDVSFKYDQADAEPRLFVQGVIANITDRVIKMPPLQVQLFDANGTLLGVKDLPYGEAQMPAKSDEFFFYELTDIPAGTVAKIEVVMKG